MVEVSCRKSGEEDVTRVSEYRKGHFPYNSSLRCYEPEYYRWKLFNNPCQQGEIWIAENNGNIVGLVTFTPKKMKVMDSVIDGAETGDSFVHPGFRRQGISTRLGLASRESILGRRFNLLYNVPSPVSWARDSKKLGYAEVPFNLMNLIRPLAIRILVQRKMPVSRRLRLAVYKAILALPFTAIRSFIRSVSGGNDGNGRSEVTVRKVDAFPDDIDIFCEKASKSFDGMLLFNRENLTWRYIRNPDTYQILVATNSEGATAGYMVTKIASQKIMSTGYIVDFLTLGDKDVFEKLLRASLKEFRRQKAGFVQTWAIKGTIYGDIIKRLGFRPYMRMILSIYQNEIGKQVISPGFKWHFTMGCSDTV